MTHDEALNALNTLVKNENLRRHHLAAGVCMKALAQFLKTKHKSGFSLFGLGSKSDIDPNSWQIVGLLHDADYERTKDRPAEHGVIILDEIRSLNYSITPEEAEAIKFHNFENTKAKESLMGWGIYTCDELTGLIVACALVRPDKKLASVAVDFVLSKMKEPAFAKGALRNRIYLCSEKLGIKLEDFVKINLEAMQSIADQLGL
ncbi:MAG: Metal dependent phosphohydrolase [Microgenomates group bacterium GW2011_GWA1_48_10]|uniref:HD domain-containing protein n=1 Tax=Candidatus Gottesmanbacteria bacterium RIFCSPHIGHO2_01_FULL_47_48 TaxID=1798381 RepID=A0A1F6A476_9BACT|nr:MAG: Metal dependent phosphohydrolase [Microgenomates group bacterium GW2011_GWA1_48_10]OGG19067.1 MAG: hypothetical protein A2721_00710 [Candidatus Gottesmanbacteria bacterium RIFCSPHIGHO2_01_FULL_47_48]